MSFTLPHTLSSGTQWLPSSKQKYYEPAALFYLSNLSKKTMAKEIPIGANLVLRNSDEDWRLVTYWDNEVPQFCRQYVIQNLHSGATRRAFKHELFEKSTYISGTI